MISVYAKWSKSKLQLQIQVPVFKIEALIRVSFWRTLKFQHFSWSARSNLRRQSKNIGMKYKTHLNLCMKYMIHIFNIMWRIKNQPSNSTSCSENAVRLLILVTGRLYWELQVTSSFSIWGCVLKGCLERGIFWRAKSRLKGIENFNLDHWQVPLEKAACALQKG